MFDVPTEYCEQLLQLGWEPINTISNVAFGVAGLLAFYALRHTHGILKFLLPLLLLLVGVGSSWWHTSHSHYGDIADTFFILLFASVVGELFLRTLLTSWMTVLLTFIVLLVIVLAAEQLPYLNGSLPYLVLFLSFVTGGTLYAKKFPDSRTLVITAAIIFGLAITFRSVDILACSMISFGTHFLWHILMAIFSYQLILLVANSQNRKPF